MAAVATRRKARPKYESIADLLHALGDISPDRVAFDPWPGRATVRDLVRLNDRGPQLYELVDRVLVEKVIGQKESALASEIIADIMVFARQHHLGYVTGEAGTYRIAPGLVSAPDVAFTSWERLGGTTLSDAAAPKIAPDLAVEVLSPGNTHGEIARKLDEYFRAGVRIVWVIDPKKRAARSHTAPDEFITLSESDALDGGDVLPGFRLPLKTLFAKLAESAAKRTPKKKNGKSRG